MKRKFPTTVLKALREERILGVRAGREPHRFIGIWMVVVEGRLFVRSWTLKERSWYRTFLEEPLGRINIKGREIAVRAVATRSERLKELVSNAYREKYDTPGSVKYARGLASPRRRATTTELVPV